MTSNYVQVRLQHDGIKKKGNVTSYNCFLVNTLASAASTNIKFGDAVVRKGFIKLGVENPPTGTYKIKCYGKQSDLVYETGENHLLNIYNSLDVEVTSVEVTEQNNTKSLTIFTNLNQPNADNIEDVFCFYRKAKNLQGSLMTNAKFVNSKSEIDCGQFSPNGGGVYQFGVLLQQSKQGLRNPQLSVAEQVISTGGPVARRAFFKNNFGSVAISFNKNIQGVDKNCDGIFTSVDVFGKGNIILKIMLHLIFNCFFCRS